MARIKGDLFPFFLGVLITAGIGFSCQNKMEHIHSDTILTDWDSKTIRFSGTIHPHRYNTYKDRANGHHLIVWSEGSNAKKALMNTSVPDRQILEALISLGAQSGNNLTEDTWDKRKDPSSPYPDLHVQGTLIQIKVAWNGVNHPIHHLFENADPHDFEIRVGGHAHLIPLWRSGCVTCLFSCPGGRTSNAIYTIRQQDQNQHVFLADTSRLPPDDTPVQISMTILEENGKKE